MNLVTVIWSMTAAACLTLAAIHFVVWCQRRSAWADLVFTMTSVGVAVYAGCELSMMLAQTPEQFASALRWIQVPTWVIVVSLAGFVRLHLRAGRRWLASCICGLRSVALLLNFLVGQNLNYLEVTSLIHVPFLGETVSLGVGTSNPWMLVGQLSLLLLAIFTVDATITVWRRGDRRMAVVTAGTIAFFAITGMVQAVLVLWRIVDMPLTESIFFLGIVVAMGYELSMDVLRAGQLSRSLQQSEQRMSLATKAQKQAEDKFRLAVEASPNGIVLTDREGRIVLVNAETEKLFGYTRDELIGQLVELLVPSRYREAHPSLRAAFVAAPTARAMRIGRDLSARRKDGTEFPVEIGLRPITSAEGLLVMTAIVDITARKNLEAETSQQRTALAHVTRVSTMGQLASALAHELNQPLGAILRNAEAAQLILQQDPPDLEEIRAILADICKDDERAGSIIDHTRAMMKRRDLEISTLAVDDLVQDVVTLIHSDAASRHVHVHVDLPPRLAAIRGDRVQLQQVLLNLMLNAMDAMDAVPVLNRRMVVRAREIDGQTVEIQVSDSGPGIPAEQFQHIFDSFFTTKRNGLGMGLPISRSIIQAHGGRLSAQNNPDRGATFRFTVPIA